ncbi:ATP phosphoribosyltransferase regulatory subunit [Pontibacillus litoralis]|uniref:ATP phosphoribosyltransferase regulatory subunit n=1 Tax=Pontibacillus litoralis JSM 072002 TaxID=1385512 RepID=A0A0A5G4X1_9BACI|nr:ATP phosphoribosyltransferase [Pontibacillus litoralis JSM 072002]
MVNNRFMFEKPLGMRDTLPFLYEHKQRVRHAIANTVTSWGYQGLETPMVEYLDTVGGASAIEGTRLFKLLDRQGHSLVLRPDLTVPIARVAASQLKEQGYPLRLHYDGPVFRAQQTEGGKPAQFEQIGVEYIGETSDYADAEVIALQIEALLASGLSDFHITIGHIGYVKGLLFEIFGGHRSTEAEQFLRYLYEKDYVGFRKAVKEVNIKDEDRQRLRQLLSLRGKHHVFAAAEEMAENGACHKAIQELKQLYQLLQLYDVHSCVSFDLTVISHMHYYTGILFEGYTPKVGASLCNGGRYDQLLPSFQSDASATGFAIHLDRLMEALGEQEPLHDRVLILYDDQTFSEALCKAQELRRNGEKVVLQWIDGISDSSYSQHFKRVVDVCRGGVVYE